MDRTDLSAALSAQGPYWGEPARCARSVLALAAKTAGLAEPGAANRRTAALAEAVSRRQRGERTPDGAYAASWDEGFFGAYAASYSAASEAMAGVCAKGAPTRADLAEMDATVDAAAEDAAAALACEGPLTPGIGAEAARGLSDGRAGGAALGSMDALIEARDALALLVEAYGARGRAEGSEAGRKAPSPAKAEAGARPLYDSKDSEPPFKQAVARAAEARSGPSPEQAEAARRDRASEAEAAAFFDRVSSEGYARAFRMSGHTRVAAGPGPDGPGREASL